jgi:hypothetical protein
MFNSLLQGSDAFLPNILLRLLKSSPLHFNRHRAVFFTYRCLGFFPRVKMDCGIQGGSNAGVFNDFAHKDEYVRRVGPAEGAGAGLGIRAYADRVRGQEKTVHGVRAA